MKNNLDTHVLPKMVKIQEPQVEVGEKFLQSQEDHNLIPLTQSSKDEIEEVNNKIKKNEIIRSSIELEYTKDKDTKDKKSNPPKSQTIVPRKNNAEIKKSKKGINSEAKSLIA